jgi:hypothetical protein
MNKILALIFAAILIAGCTTQSRGSNADLSGLEELEELPKINSSGMPELESLPSTNISIDLDTGIPSENPFPSMPALE